MSRLRGLARLCRISNLPTVWTNVLAASILSGSGDLLRQFPILVLSMSLLYCGGMALNDLVDVDEDRISRPDRPIPAAEVKPGEALALVIALLGGGLLLLLLTHHQEEAMTTGAVLVAAIIGYDLLHRRTPWSILLMASCRGLVFITVALSMRGVVPLPAALAASVQFLYVLIISVTARFDKSHPFSLPVIPAMIAGISVIDGIMISVWHSAAGLAAGLVAAMLTLSGQQAVRGD